MIVGAPSAGGFGFEVPQGTPGNIEAASRGCATWGAALGARASAVRSGAKAACSGWNGSAETGFVASAAQVISVYESLGLTVDDAGRALATFARELDTAQQITKQALQECETLSQQVSTSQQEAATHGLRVQALNTQVASAVHPAQVAELSRQLTTAQDQQTAAEHAANQAQGQLEAAQQRGIRAWTDYQQQAQASAQVLQGLNAQIHKAERMPGTASSPGTAGPGIFWPTLNGVIGSSGGDAAIGFAEGLASRYRDSDLVLPITQGAEEGLEDMAGKVTGDGDLFTQLPGGIWVPRGSSADPLIGEIQGLTTGEGFNTPGKPFMVANADDLEGAAPGWASTAGKTLGVAGVGITLYSTGADQWEYDSTHHPGWSTTHKVIDSAQATVVVGGSTAVVAWGGAEIGAETGAEAGAAIGTAVPVVGTVAGGVIGGVVGGVAGGLAGGEVGKDIGHGFEDAGSGIAHAASDAWNAIF